MALKRINADPNSELDYSVNWSNWLVAESLSTSEWFVDEKGQGIVEFYNEGISVESPGSTYTFIKFDTDQANEGDEYTITNRINTTSLPPRVEDQSFIIVIVEK